MLEKSIKKGTGQICLCLRKNKNRKKNVFCLSLPSKPWGAWPGVSLAKCDADTLRCRVRALFTGVFNHYIAQNFTLVSFTTS